MITLSPAAHAKIAEVLSDDPESMFRVSVKNGGCAGNQYTFTTETSQKPSDVVFQQKDFAVIIDKQDLEKLNGSSIDFIEELQGSHFSVDNPNTTRTCNCGGSFSI